MAQARFLILLIALLVYLISSTFFRGFIGFRILLDIFFSLILLAGINAFSQKKSRLIIAAALAFPLFVSIWLDYLAMSTWVIVVGRFFGILFFAYAIVLFLSYLFAEEAVTRDTLFAAIIVYLLIGLMWSLLYSVMELLQPGTFAISHGQFKGHPYYFLYYSFVTLTTLGYGDITPADPRASVFAILEAIIGQIYLAVLVARLVGLHIVHSGEKKNG